MFSKFFHSTRHHNSFGFTLIELLIAIVIVGIAAGIAIPCFMAAQDRAHVGAARADVNLFRRALGMFELDNADYPQYLTLITATATLVDPQGKPYISLPSGDNLRSFQYRYLETTVPTSYIIDVWGKDRANDKMGTHLRATPDGVIEMSDSACIDAAIQDLQVVQKLTRLFGRDHGGYPRALTLEKMNLFPVDSQGQQYEPWSTVIGINFASFAYECREGLSFTVKVECYDSKHTMLIATPTEIFNK